MAPEIVNHQIYDKKVDIWSVGVVIYTLICGKQPFLGNSKEKIYEAIKCQEPDMDCPEWQHVSL